MTHSAPFSLQGARVLVLEDEFYIASDLSEMLSAAGAEVVGPFRRVDDAMTALGTNQPAIALVDINLGLGPTYEVPRRLQAAAVPFAFVTGYDEAAIPAEFAHVPRIEKPVSATVVRRTAEKLLREPAST